MVTLGRITNPLELDRRRRQCLGLTILAQHHSRHIPWKKKTATSPTVSDYTLDSHHLAHLYTILLWWLALSQILSFWIVLLRVNSILGDSREQNLTLL